MKLHVSPVLTMLVCSSVLMSAPTQVHAQSKYLTSSPTLAFGHRLRGKEGGFLRCYA
jgi:hypothetical protein